MNQVTSSGVQTTYADGFARLSVHRGIVFLEFYQEAHGNDSEKNSSRHVTQRIALPLSGLGELSHSIAAFETEMRNRQSSNADNQINVHGE